MNPAHPGGESMIPSHQENGQYFFCRVIKFWQAYVFGNIVQTLWGFLSSNPSIHFFITNIARFIL
jgi:hypothetical protein